MQQDVVYRDGGHVWVSIPRLDMYDYHPFSITSTPAAPEWRGTMLLQCKAYDKWTQVRLNSLSRDLFSMYCTVARAVDVRRGTNGMPCYTPSTIYLPVCRVSDGW